MRTHSLWHNMRSRPPTGNAWQSSIAWSHAQPTYPSRGNSSTISTAGSRSQGGFSRLRSWHRHPHAQLRARHGFPLRKRAVLGEAGLLECGVLLDRRRRLRKRRMSCCWPADLRSSGVHLPGFWQTPLENSSVGAGRLSMLLMVKLPHNAPRASEKVLFVVQAVHSYPRETFTAGLPCQMPTFAQCAALM